MNSAHDLRGGLVPVEGGVGFRQLWGACALRGVLRARLNAAGLNVGEGLDQ